MAQYKNMREKTVHIFLSRIQVNVYLSRVKDFVFLTSSNSIAVDADPGASTATANRSHIGDSKGISVTSSGHKDIKVNFVFGVSSKFLQR